jgi:hypothetical protein
MHGGAAARRPPTSPVDARLADAGASLPAARPRLKEQDAGDDLEAVGKSVLHFLKQHLLHLQHRLHLSLSGAPIGDVLDGEQ